MASVINSASGGFESKSQRRGVTPLVLLLNLSGNISARSLTVVVRSSSRVDLCDPVGAMRADDGQIRHPHMLYGSFFDQADALYAASSPGNRLRTTSSRRRLISKMISS